MYKVKEVYKHTETVYYTDDGTEVGRVRNYDDYWYDSEAREGLEDWEIEEYAPKEEN